MMKRFLAGALACAMVFSVSTVAFAADGAVDAAKDGVYASDEIKGDSALEALTVSVTVPTDISVTVNPYKLEVTVDSDKVKDQIVGRKDELVSASNVDLAVGIKIGAEKKVADGKTNNAVISSKSLAGDTKTTTNAIFSYLEVTGGKEKREAKKTYTAPAKGETGTQFVFPELKVKGDTKSGYLEQSAVVTLAGGASDGTEKAAFQVKGDAVSAPAKVWTTDDVLTYYITYNFVPVVAADTTTTGA